jgi:hypothetical protein
MSTGGVSGRRNRGAGRATAAGPGLRARSRAGHHDVQPYLLLVQDGGPCGLPGWPWRLPRPSGTARPAERGLLASNPARGGRTGRAGSRRADAPGADRQPALDEPDIGRVLRRLPPMGPRDRAPALDHWRTHWPSRCAPSSTAPPTARNASATAMHAPCCARWKAGCRPMPMRRAGCWPCCWTACTAPACCRRRPVAPAAPRGWPDGARAHQRTGRVVLEDLALSFELLRLVNSAQVRGGQVSGSGPGADRAPVDRDDGLDGVRRAALALREWPGPCSTRPPRPNCSA